MFAISKTDPTCPFDCCQVWKGKVPVPDSWLTMNTEEYLQFMAKEKRKITGQSGNPKIKTVTSELRPDAVEVTGSTRSQLQLSFEKHGPKSGKSSGMMAMADCKPVPSQNSRLPKHQNPQDTSWSTKLNVVSCYLCDRYFLSNNELIKHLTRHHTPNEIFG